MRNQSVEKSALNYEDFLFYGDEDRDLSVLMYLTRDIMARARELELMNSNLTSSQAGILLLTSRRKEGWTIGEISYLTLREPHSVLALVNRMEANGLIKKVTGGRSTRIVITAKGRRLYKDRMPRSTKLIFSALTQKEKKLLKSILKKMRAKGRELLGMNNRLSYRE